MKKRPATRPPADSWSILDSPRYRERFAFALAVSLYYHVLLILFLRFDATGLGLPWAEPRAQRPELTLRMEHALRPPAPVPAVEPVPLAVPPRVPPTTTTAEQPQPVTPPRTDFVFEVRLVEATGTVPSPAPLSVPRRETRATAPAAKARARDRKIQAKPERQILALSTPQEETFKVPPPKLAEPEQRAPDSAAKKQTEEQAARKQVEEDARLQAEEAARQRAEEDARQRALALQKELEAKKQEEARRLEDAKKQEEARRLALELEARRRAEETARQEAEELARQRSIAMQKEQEAKKLEDARRVEELQKQEEARKQEETKKQEEVRRLALEAEALRRAEEAARQKAEARRKELEAQRQAEEAAARAKESAERQRLEAQAAAPREGERLALQQAPALAPAPGALSGKDLAAKALEQLRTPGATRDGLLRPPSPPARADDPRRRSLFGVERDVGLRMYVDSWRLKIERNGALNYRPSAGWRARDNPPIVTVSIRSDGSLEDVWIHQSSGVREIDEAVRRIVRLNAPYSAFPPALARQYDVIEIRRVWHFDDTLRILDEM